ncbi:hypothetical protein OAB57_03190 [Bacteriovoracaceae bacterium]|nr:hypothetical protein [Bacteriovoracaceae bacterium]
MRAFSNLVKWSKQFNDLPWRKKRSPYGTLVSEFMLQQTTVGTVIDRYEKFQKKFPNIRKLADSNESELLKYWEGLGYYRRAMNLLKSAKMVMLNYDGKIPSEYFELRGIPGIGPYTANAILSLGFEKKALALDTNLERVISRMYCIDAVKGPKLQKYIYEMFNEGRIFKNFFDKYSSRLINESLMDLGRVFCKSRNPICNECPISKHCLSYNSGIVNLYPLTDTVKVKKKKKLQLLRVIVISGNEILFVRRKKNEWLADQWEAPSFVIHSDDPTLNQYKAMPENINYESFDKIGIFNSLITSYKIENEVVVIDQKYFVENLKKYFLKNECLYISKKEMSKYNITSATKKMTKIYLDSL